jgi:predicted 3-demethylubiquinone-9 3-methyltransferase (glyoxalase superfamily)
MQKITPFLWFNDNAEEAVQFYVSVFKNSRIVKVRRYGKAGAKASGRPKGSVMTILFELEGQEFAALNGGPHFKFTEAISLVVNCKTQKEVDELWDKLSANGEGTCGWLKDKFGLSWQIVPTAFFKLLDDRDEEKVEKVMEALMQMGKLDLKTLQQAYERA